MRRPRGGARSSADSRNAISRLKITHVVVSVPPLPRLHPKRGPSRAHRARSTLASWAVVERTWWFEFCSVECVNSVLEVLALKR